MAISAEGFSAWHPETTTRALESQNAATFMARVEWVAIFAVHRSRLCSHYQLKHRPLLDSIIFQCRLPRGSLSHEFSTLHNFLAVEDESLLISWDAQLSLNRHLDKLDWKVFLELDYPFFARDENHCHLKPVIDELRLVFCFRCWCLHAADAAGAGAGAGTVGVKDIRTCI